MEQSPRPTKEITLPNGAVIVCYEYITLREKRAINRAYTDQATIKQTGDGKGKSEIEIGGVTASVNETMEDIALKAIITEVRPVGGDPITDKEKILEFVLNLSETDGNLVVAAINEITEPKKA